MTDSLSNNPAAVDHRGRAATKAGARCLLALSSALTLLWLTPWVARAQDGLWKTYLEAAAKSEERDDDKEAERRYKLALEKARELGENDHRLALAALKLSAFYFKNDKPALAEPLYKQAHAIWEKNAGPYPLETAETIEKTVGGYPWNSDKRESLYKLVLEIRRKNLKPGHILIAYGAYNLANNYSNRSKYVEAKPLYKEALDIIERHPQYGIEHSDYSNVLVSLVQTYVELENYKEAEESYNHAIDATVEVGGEEHPEVAKRLSRLFEFYKRRKRYKDAEKTMRRLIDIRVKAFGDYDSSVSEGWNALAEMHSEAEEFEEAEAAYNISLSITEKRGGEDAEAGTARLHNRLGKLYQRKNRDKLAEASFKKAIAIYERNPYDVDELTSSRENLADLYQSKGQFTEAEAELKKNLTLAEAAVKAIDKDSPDFLNERTYYRLVHSLERYASLMRKMEKGSEAAAAEARAKQFAAKIRDR